MKAPLDTSESWSSSFSLSPGRLKPELQQQGDKFLLICPAERPQVSALAAASPLVNLCILGKPFLHYWMEHLARRGAKEIKILAVDRPEQVREIVADGARWGLRVEIIPESHELSCDEAREKYFSNGARPSGRANKNGSANSVKLSTFANSKRRQRHAPCPADQTPSTHSAPGHLPDMLALIDHLPGLPKRKLFESYNDLFSSIQTWLSKNPGPMQIGMKEIKPGVWSGLRTQISPRAKLRAPCWIGENVLVKADAEIGPLAILENGVVVENAAAISESWIGTQTFVGSLTQVKDSLAFGNTLVNFRTDSLTQIPDAFLLCALRNRKTAISSARWIGRLAAVLFLVLTLPFTAITILKAKSAGHRTLRPRRAAAPQFARENSAPIIYFEFANANGWWKRWPQLWNVARGEFTWIGNRPLTPIEAGKLTNDFERLWLASPIGLISQADAEGCTDVSSDEARAHASFYAAQANWRLDFAIFFRAMKRLAGRKLATSIAHGTTAFKPREIELNRVVIR